MKQSTKSTIPLRIDEYRQLWVSLSVSYKGRVALIDFKVDTGCNCVILNRASLKLFGLSPNEEWFKCLPPVKAQVANGGVTLFKALGSTAISYNGNEICDVSALCHSARETHNLLGMEAFEKYEIITFDKSAGELRLER